ncbi:MAG: hypothetical protein HY696_06305 [Deltaproteobacteria bacterium]|nr:hypothetical protein [Deltaproteobacteria bacterium]
MSGLRQLRRSIADAHHLRHATRAGNAAAATRLRSRHPGIAAVAPPRGAALQLMRDASQPTGVRCRDRGASAAVSWGRAAGLALTIGAGFMVGLSEARAAGADQVDTPQVDAFGLSPYLLGLYYLGALAMQGIDAVFANWRRAITWPLDVVGKTVGGIADGIGLAAAARASEQRGLFFANVFAGSAHGVAAALRPSGPIRNAALAPQRVRPRNTQHTIASGLAAAASFLRAGRLLSAAAVLNLTRWKVNHTASPETLDHLDLLRALVREQARNWAGATRTIVWSRSEYGPDVHFPTETHTTRQWLRELVADGAILSIADKLHLRTFDALLEDYSAVRAVLAANVPA